MNNKDVVQKVVLGIIVVVVVLAGVSYLLWLQQTTPTPTPTPTPSPSISLLQACPEHWYINQMLGPIDQGESGVPKEYFIYNGERQELIDFDLAWVEANCAMEPEYVY